MLETGEEAVARVDAVNIYAHALAEHLPHDARIALAHEARINIDAVHLLSDRPVHERRAHGGIHAAGNRHERVPRAHPFANLRHHVLDEVLGRPGTRAAADILKIGEDRQPVGVVALHAELHPVELLLLVGEGRRQPVAVRDDLKALGQLQIRQPRDIAVAVGKPLKQRRGLRKMRLQRLLFQRDMAHAAPQLRRHAPRREAHGQHRHAHFVNGGIAQRRVVLNAALGPARQYDAPRIERAYLVHRRVRGHNFAVDLSAAHTPRQRLRVRAAIAQYEDAVPFHADPSAACAPGARR